MGPDNLRPAGTDHDPDTSQLLEVLRGASRAVKDPDIELVELLSELSGKENLDDAKDAVLERLARDANSD